MKPGYWKETKGGAAGSSGWNSLDPGFKFLEFEPDVTCDLANCLKQLKISEFTDCWGVAGRE